MADTRAAKLRRLWLNVHLWIGVGLAVMLIPISISGALLVWHDDIDTWINPHRYAVTGAKVALPPTVYLAKAVEAVAKDPTGLRANAVRYPEPGWPIRVMMRAQGREPGARPKIVTVFLDPPTATVLDVMEFRSSFFGFLHVFHENLTIPEYSGRQIVGWVGVGMLIMSLTGLWLWWPRGSDLLYALRWKRSTRFTFNLHHLLGFWISMPLAVVSLTGIYLAFPQTARDAMSSITTMNQQPPRGGQPALHTSLTADRALEVALKAAPGATPAALFLPLQQRGEGALNWRVQLAERGETLSVTVDDRSGQSAVTRPQPGDRAAAWIRWIHEGSQSGPIWAVIVFLTGVFPTVFAVTGIIMSLRKRADRKALKAKRANPSCDQPSEHVSMVGAERIESSMSRYCHRYHVAVAAVVAISLILPFPLFGQTTPAEPPSTPAASPPTTTQQVAPVVSDPVPAAQPSAPQPSAASPDIALKLPRDLSPWGMFTAADIVVKAVMVGLAFASVLTWTIWFAKAIELMIARRRMRATINALNQARSWSEAVARMKGRDNGPAALLRAADAELLLSADAMSPTGVKERIASRLERLEAAAGRSMIRGTGILATIGATAPFVGLFGTVWGIMNSFIGISKSHTTNLAVVAPGIAEALLATALGLVAAIPAVVMYNVFSRWIAGYRALHADTAAEILRIVSRDLDRGAFDERRADRRRAIAAE